MYAKEYHNYQSVANGASYQDYYNQECEIQARKYGAEAMLDYFEKINDYLGVDDPDFEYLKYIYYGDETDASISIDAVDSALNTLEGEH